MSATPPPGSDRAAFEAAMKRRGWTMDRDARIVYREGWDDAVAHYAPLIAAGEAAVAWWTTDGDEAEKALMTAARAAAIAARGKK